MSAPAVERLQDLDALLLADGDVLDARVGIDVEAELLGELAHAALGRRRVEQHAGSASARCASTMFSATVITGMSMKCWCTIPIPASIASLRRAERRRLAVQEDLALVGPVQAVEDVHQRRLAGAVLAEQRVHLAAAEVEVDVVVREDAGEALRDAAQLEDGLRSAATSWRFYGRKTEEGGHSGPPSSHD